MNKVGNWEVYLETARPTDLRLVIQCGEYSQDTDDFLDDLLEYCEYKEKYELCSVIYDEINFRIRLLNDFYGFGEYEYDESDDE